MDYILERNHIEDYLKDSRYVDFRADNIQKEAGRLFDGCGDECAKIKAAFEFVRDDVAHSWDIQSERITRTASEVLRYREGICYAKSMLLAALLRSAGIPTGFCYQRLTLGDTPDTGYCVHALNGRLYFCHKPLGQNRFQRKHKREKRTVLSRRTAERAIGISRPPGV